MECYFYQENGENVRIQYATSFNQNLCPWGSRAFDPSNGDVKEAFASTACPELADADLSSNPPGPF